MVSTPPFSPESARWPEHGSAQFAVPGEINVNEHAVPIPTQLTGKVRALSTRSKLGYKAADDVDLTVLVDSPGMRCGFREEGRRSHACDCAHSQYSTSRRYGSVDPVALSNPYCS